MTEHPIIIQLSPQEREVAIKLANEAGYTSVDEFIKFFVMDALSKRMSDGKETSAKGQENGSLQHVAGEIRRLHNELKSFLPKSDMATEGVYAITNIGGASQFPASNKSTSAKGAATPSPM